MIIYKSSKKSQTKKKDVFRKKNILGKVVITTDGILLGDVKKIIDNNLYLNPGIDIDIRKYQIKNKKFIILPIDGITSIDDIILYELPELDPKLIHKNHDEQMFIDQFFKSDYSINLRIKF